MLRLLATALLGAMALGEDADANALKVENTPKLGADRFEVTAKQGPQAGQLTPSVFVEGASIANKETKESVDGIAALLCLCVCSCEDVWALRFVVCMTCRAIQCRAAALLVIARLACAAAREVV
jgi:hypothetical protein